MPNCKRKPKNKKKRAIALLCLVCAGAACAVLLGQESKLRSIYAEQAKLEADIAAQEEEKARLEYMIEYTQNDAYLIQYAREKLGYVKPGEVKFNIED